MSERKGIILAGGTGSRLWPITLGVSKQLLPVYDKPMIYYPLSVLMLSGISSVALITTPEDQPQFRRLLKDGSQWGIDLTYLAQPSPEGLAQAYIIAEDFLAAAPSAMVLGDNIFFGHGLTRELALADRKATGATIFGYQVADPSRYGVAEFDDADRVVRITEKPQKPASNYAVTGLYFLDGSAPQKAQNLRPSARGELEIADLLELYVAEGALSLRRLGRGYAWLDTGTHGSLLDAANFVRTLQSRQGLQVGCPEEIAFDRGWIDRAGLAASAARYASTAYGQYLERIAKQ
jgi:glucose-1-phosphate thymidylyltransferase